MNCFGETVEPLLFGHVSFLAASPASLSHFTGNAALAAPNGLTIIL